MRRSASSDVIGERLRWLGILKDVELVDANLTDSVEPDPHRAGP